MGLQAKRTTCERGGRKMEGSACCAIILNEADNKGIQTLNPIIVGLEPHRCQQITHEIWQESGFTGCRQKRPNETKYYNSLRSREELI